MVRLISFVMVIFINIHTFEAFYEQGMAWDSMGRFGHTKPPSQVSALIDLKVKWSDDISIKGISSFGKRCGTG